MQAASMIYELKQIRSDKDALALVKTNPLQLEFIPIRFRTRRVCIYAVCKNPCAAVSVPRCYFNDENFMIILRFACDGKIKIGK